MDYEPEFYNRQYDRLKLETVTLYFGQKDLQESAVSLCQIEVILEHPIDNHDIFLITTGRDSRSIGKLKVPILFFAS